MDQQSRAYVWYGGSRDSSSWRERANRKDYTQLYPDRDTVVLDKHSIPEYYDRYSRPRNLRSGILRFCALQHFRGFRGMHLSRLYRHLGTDKREQNLGRLILYWKSLWTTIRQPAGMISYYRLRKPLKENSGKLTKFRYLLDSLWAGCPWSYVYCWILFSCVDIPWSVQWLVVKYFRLLLQREHSVSRLELSLQL